MAEFEVEGLDEFCELLSKPRLARITKRYLLGVEKKAVRPVIAAMQTTVPHDQGGLENSLTYQSHFKKEGGGETLTVKIGPNTKIHQPSKLPNWVVGLIFEFGAKAGRKMLGAAKRSHKKRTPESHAAEDTIEARHWMKQAWDSSKQQALAAFRNAAQELVERFKE
jgi:hypothetical protein